MLCPFVGYKMQKKSREESSGAGSGVEILINEPYENGPGGNGQYTRKIYHVGSHLPGWIKGKFEKKKLVLYQTNFHKNRMFILQVFCQKVH